MRTAEMVALGRFMACEGRCGDIVVHGRYCPSCQRIADEFEEREPRSAGGSFAGILAGAALFFLIGFGLLSAVEQFLSRG